MKVKTEEKLAPQACQPEVKTWTLKEHLVTSTHQHLLPLSNEYRKKIPLSSGVLDYFSSALIEVAKVSHFGNEQHNPGEPLHWARGKSMNQEDSLLHHYMERGTFDEDGQRHSAKMAWRALAILQLEMEAAGAPMARGAR